MVRFGELYFMASNTIKSLLSGGIFLFLLLVPSFAVGQSLSIDTTYRSADNSFSFLVPKNWSSYAYNFTALKGGKVEQVVVTQQIDTGSRTVKYFLLEAGSPASIFGLNSKVVEKLSHEQLLDFYIDQFDSSTVNLKIGKTYTTGEGEKKIYTFESTYTLSGPYTVIAVHSFQFKDGKVYHWFTRCFSTHSIFLPTLQQISDSVEIK